MSGYWFSPDDYAPEPPTVQGSGHSVSGEPPAKDPAEAVRAVAEEVSRKRMPRPAPRRIGF